MATISNVPDGGNVDATSISHPTGATIGSSAGEN